MRERALSIGWFVLAAPLLACGRTDSSVIVKVTAEPAVMGVFQLRASVSNAGEGTTRSFPATPATRAIVFDTAFSLTIPRDRTGPLDIALDGLDEGGTAVANGTASVDLHAGENGPVTITLRNGASTCGNGLIDSGEACDDGDQFSNGDCDYTCQPRTPPTGTAGAGGGGTGGGGAGTGGTAGTGGAGGSGGRPCTIELLTNGDFEGGDAGWTSHSPNGRPLIYRYTDVDPAIAPPAQSIHIAWLGYDLVSNTVSLSQAIQIPADAVSFTVSGSVAIQTGDSTSMPFDFAYVEMVVGAMVDSEGSWSNVDQGSAWVPFSVTHAATGFAGANGVFQLRAKMDDGGNTNFFFDNLSVVANVCR